MDPARTFGPDMISLDFGAYWVYVAGPIGGAVVAVVRCVRAARCGRRLVGVPVQRRVRCSPRPTSPASHEAGRARRRPGEVFVAGRAVAQVHGYPPEAHLRVVPAELSLGVTVQQHERKLAACISHFGGQQIIEPARTESGSGPDMAGWM